jgi:hypothetical protein
MFDPQPVPSGLMFFIYATLYVTLLSIFVKVFFSLRAKKTVAIRSKSRSWKS